MHVEVTCGQLGLTFDYVFKTHDVMVRTPEGSRVQATTSVRSMEV